MSDVTVAALFVEENGVYAGRPDVDVWGISRDARKYPGPYPVVAHPPCERWGRYAGANKGQDGGCFEKALEAVWGWGGGGGGRPAAEVGGAWSKGTKGRGAMNEAKRPGERHG